MHLSSFCWSFGILNAAAVKFCNYAKIHDFEEKKFNKKKLIIQPLKKKRNKSINNAKSK